MANDETLASIRAELMVAQNRRDFKAVEIAMKKLELKVADLAFRRQVQSQAHAAPIWDRDDSRQ